MSDNELPQDQKRKFEARCEKDGLHPDGFDVTCVPGATSTAPLTITIKVGKRDYRYDVAAGDYSWIDTFFHQIKQVGDPGDGVAVIKEDEAEAVSRSVGLHSGRTKP